jgi:hypothetical protein
MKPDARNQALLTKKELTVTQNEKLLYTARTHAAGSRDEKD